ncbi:MAG: phosphotransferase [Novosphingobium sp.]
MIKRKLPTAPEELTVDILNDVIADFTPDVVLTGFDVMEKHVWGSGTASSAGRVVIEPVYGETGSSQLPRRIVVKVANSLAGDPTTPDPIAGAHGALYRNEVAIYRELRPNEFLEAPRALGGAYDETSNSLMLLLEDLRDRGVTFASVTTPTSLDRMRSLLDQLATLHAKYWNHPEHGGSLDWMEAHTRGIIHDKFNDPNIMAAHIANQVATEQFKREMVERLGTTVDGLFRQFQLVQQHQATLPQTVCHGDTHIGNTYILPDDRGGLLDWQLASVGFAMHDVSYLVATGLSVGQRRKHERELLTYYRMLLLEKGAVDVPSPDMLWLEYSRAMVWGVYIGWLTTPVPNYGWEITVLAHLRTMTAYEDLETARLIEQLA